jgi:membrane-associated PAP2 superfamily phosphatase
MTQAVWPTLLVIGLFISLQYGGLDLRVAHLFYDPALGRFPLRDNFWANQVFHDGARQVLVGLALLILVAWGLSWRVPTLRRQRAALAYLSITVLLSMLLVQQLKSWTNVDCPWDVAGLGGLRPHINLFADKPDTLPAGHCFPGGHSSGGCALLAFYFVGGVHRARRWPMLLPGLLTGSVFAVDQWARGAHFPSHDLASAYLCWMVALGMATLFERLGHPPQFKPLA